MSGDPKLSEFLADHARSSDDLAEWYEQQAWRMVQRAQALEAVVEAARRSLAPAATVEHFDARDALIAALEALDGTEDQQP